ncbi:alpha/beta hydrolase-fold protein [Flavivirga aquimarina]|uniref:Alpha/beta hydrolase-fold protein n=1 Tax=Flavivirga aquimarina TaxID=2027862 RepID=A0ABT8WCI8_9FLAO|nr:alpha/beta hydrolase-fold protein [Flavivirga aquimarina]MDO5970862.1 alpha/beta hydrolase-fold protein [Flavivirga aquimarina]
MKYKWLLLMILLFQTINSQSQKLGDLKIIDSKVLKEKRNIKVLLPSDYSTENKYPVIYITDANYNFEIASTYLTQLIKFNAVPKTILVGITQEKRWDELDVFWKENGIKFKDFIFNELIPYINTEYSTSGFNAIIGHSDGAEYNHLLMLQENNPFRGFINISENLNTDISNGISEYFKAYKGKKLFYFIASGKYDSKYRIAAGEAIENFYKNYKNTNIIFQNKLYDADHQNLLSKSLIDGISYIFQDYRNLSNYNGFKDYVKNYKGDVESIYGFTPNENRVDVDHFFVKALDTKNLELYEYIVEYCRENKIFNFLTYDRSWHYYYMGQHSKSIQYWNKTIENFEGTSPRVFYYNFKKAIDSYSILNNPKGAIEFLEKCKKVLPEYILEFDYFIAKVSYERNVEKRKGKKSLKYCWTNYKENRYFKKEDLDKLKIK